MLLRGLMDFEERARVYFDDSIHELDLPVPYHTDAPVRHRVTTAVDGAPAVRERSFVDDPYVAELAHFHACVTRGETCRTPPEQARLDLAVLRDLFLRRDTDHPPRRA
jgi:predicted dehydrogenase